MKKTFKRLLKELGIYQAYVDDRMMRTSSRKDVWHYASMTFPEIIDNSLTWRYTAHEKLWEGLYDASPPWAPKKILNDKASYEKLKKICDEYFKTLE